MHPLIQDLRFTFRLMHKRLGMTLLVIAALVLGIGLNTAIFSVVNAVLLRPIPVFQPDRVVWLHSKINKTGTELGTSYPDFLDWRTQSRSFESMAAVRAFSFILSGSGPPEHINGFAISASGFKTWGITTVLGRNFTDEDDRPGAKRVAILGYAYWQRNFGGNRAILGATLILDDQQYTVIGVLQPVQVNVLRYPDVWVTNGPMLDQQVMERDARYFFPAARLKTNVTLAQASAELETIANRLAAEYPAADKDMGIRVESLVEQLTSDGRRPVLLLLVASTLIFLLATVNIVTVFMGNTIERAQELAVRIALGTSRSKLLRQLLIQSLTFAIAGGLLGFLLAKFGLAYFLHRFPDAARRFHETTIDLTVVLAGLAMALLVTLTAAIGPAIYASKLEVGTALKGEWSWLGLGKGRTGARTALILFEVALASGLSLVSGLLIKSLYAVEKIDLGFKPSHLFSFQVNLPPTRYKEPSRQSALYELALENLRHLPGTASVSAVSGLPLTSQGAINYLQVDTQSPLAGEQLVVEDESVLPDFFQTMSLPILQGRDFTAADRAGAPPVVIVDNVLAAKLWPGQNPLGKRVRMTGLKNQEWRWMDVIGVVREIKHFGGPEAKIQWMQLYVPQYQDPTPVLSFVLNTSLTATAIQSAVKKAIHDLDANLPVDNFESMNDYLDVFLSGRKVVVLLLGGFAAIGVVLGAIGIYGVIASSVTQRRREIAIRMALGSTPAKAMLLVTRHALAATAAGILIGFGIVMTLSRVLSSSLYGVSSLDPTIHAISAVLLIVIAVVASVIPAARVLGFDIQEILRQ
jgi:putative ABC transport system permease protein